MNGFYAGRVAGVPVLFNSSFALLVVLFWSPYLYARSAEQLFIGLFVLIGGIASILLHELAHAAAGRLCKVDPLYIELHGLGGACHFSRVAMACGERIFISLAGPAANFALWGLFHWLGVGVQGLFLDTLDDAPTEAMESTRLQTLILCVSIALSTLAHLNIAMFVFNMLPSFPLDGGQAMAELFAKRWDLATGTRVMATLGFAVCAWCVYRGLVGHSFWMFVLAWSLYLANSQALATLGRRTWTRWN